MRNYRLNNKTHMHAVEKMHYSFLKTSNNLKHRPLSLISNQEEIPSRL
jgi:hypothetical protein